MDESLNISMENIDKESQFKQSLRGKKIPILTLDKKWHQLFVRASKTEEIQALEKDLNELLKRQGKLNTELKQLNQIKKRLMADIMELSAKLDQEPSSTVLISEMDTNKRLLNECKEKIASYQDECLDLPHLIDEANRKLMHETMKICYEWLQANFDEIEEISQWITQIRIELKTNMIRKQEMEMKNQLMYSYMHDIFGPEVMEIFDFRYDADDTLLKTTKKSEEGLQNHENSSIQ